MIVPNIFFLLPPEDAVDPQQREDPGRRRKKAKAPRQRHPHYTRGRETQSQTDLHQDNKLGIQKEHLVTLFEEISNKKREKIKCFCFLPGYLQWRPTWVKPKEDLCDQINRLEKK